jgi:hypothetical protein
MSKKINRLISLPLLILYGLGTMIGGGFLPYLERLQEKLLFSRRLLSFFQVC